MSSNCESKESEEKHENKQTLPSLPDTLFELTEEQEKPFKYTGDKEDLVLRLKHKLFLTWQIWSKFRNNEKIIAKVNQIEDNTSDEFYIANELVCMIDAIGRTLKETDIVEELFENK